MRHNPVIVMIAFASISANAAEVHVKDGSVVIGTITGLVDGEDLIVDTEYMDDVVIEWDAVNDIPKISPLHRWSLKDVQDYIHEHDVPYNVLHDQGFISIGCASCTRAVKPGEDIRAGRWWWESPEQKECGIHMVDGKIVRDQERSDPCDESI